MIIVKIKILFYYLFNLYLITFSVFVFWMLFSLLFWYIYLKIELYISNPNFVFDTYTFPLSYHFSSIPNFLKFVFFCILKCFGLYRHLYMPIKFSIIKEVNRGTHSYKTIQFYVDCLLFKNLFTRGFFFALTVPLKIIWNYLFSDYF